MINVPIVVFVLLILFADIGLYSFVTEIVSYIAKRNKDLKEKKERELTEKIAKQVDLILCEERIKFFNGVQKAIDLVKKDKKTRSKK